MWFIHARRYHNRIANGNAREGTRSHIRSNDRLGLISGQRLLDLIATNAPLLSFLLELGAHEDFPKQLVFRRPPNTTIINRMVLRTD